MDLMLRGGVLPSGQQVDVGIADGVIAALEPQLTQTARQEIDLEGALLLPAFVNGHLHACKSFWRPGLARLEQPIHLEDATQRFAAIHRVKQGYTVEDVAARAERSIRLAVQHGTCALRLFADVDEAAGLTALQALLQLRHKYRRWLTIQVVAFPQGGVVRERQTAQLLQQALELGADLLGGIPWIEPHPQAQHEHIELVLQLATQHRVEAHFVLDDTTDPASRTAEYLAQRLIGSPLQGRVNGTQANALASYDQDYATRVIQLIRQSQMTLFANGHVALVTAAGRPVPRGVTRVHELLEAGVPLALAQDDIDNPYYPFGRNDLLEVALLMAHAAPLAWGSQLSQLLAMITEVPARVLGLPRYGLRVGSPAHLLVLEAPTWPQALQFQANKRLVLLHGQLVAQTQRTTQLLI